jgi:8-hydroxy-5-deazaflavin:NADPH oxidoreductase
MSKKIGILGSGIVAQTLAGGFLKFGFKVKMGTRNPEKLEAFLQKHSENKSLEIGTFEECINFGEIIVLAVKGNVAKPLVEQFKNSLARKVVMDPTNPISDISPVDGVLNFF